MRSLKMKITKTVNIKKYSNRKLYAPKGELADYGAYITLSDVANTIKQGNSVNITSKEGEDVTNVVLKEVVKELNMSTDELVKLIRS